MARERTPRRGSLHRRFLLASLTLALGFGLGTGYVSYRIKVADQEQHCLHMTELSLRLLRHTAALPVVAGESERLKDLCETVLASSRTFAAVGIRDATGKLVAQAGHLSETFLPSSGSPYLHRGALRLTAMDSEEGEDRTSPPVGWIEIQEDEAFIRLQSRAVLIRHGHLTLILIIMLLLAGRFLLHRVVHPLERLGETAQRIASGDFDARVDSDIGGDEVARLAALFNDMAESLRQRDEGLQRAAEVLEDKVRERTADLERSSLENTRLAAAVNAAAEGICVTDSKGSILYVNPAFKQLVGVEDEDVLGLRPFEVLCPDQMDLLLPSVWESLEATDSWEQRIQGRRRNGTPLLFDLTVSAVRNEGGELVHLVGISRDVTRMNALEESLREARRMEAIGRLAGGIAHDFNNSLTIMKGNAEYVRDRLGHDDPHAPDLFRIINRADEAAKLVNNLLAFSSRQVQEPTTLHLHEVIERANAMLRRTLGEHIQIELELDPDTSTVLADPTQMDQVVLNLALNAKDAMPDGGTLSVRTRDLRLQGDGQGALAGVPAGHWVMLEVEDTGIGMDAETRAKVFEPFFTTKNSESRAGGMGLASVYGIIRQSHGHVTVESKLAVGTTFRVLLPRYEAAFTTNVMPEKRSDAADAAPCEGTERILFVEDEEPIREILSRNLERYGYTVLSAGDAEEAIELIATGGEGHDVLVTDVLLPGMNGARLAEQLAVMGHGRPVLFISGYSDDPEDCPVTLPPSAAFLKKPFGAEKLARRIRCLLSR